MDSTQQKAKRYSRAGRPRMGEVPIDMGAQTEVRRLRMREAQRKYRAKKADVLSAANEKSAQLESALQGMLQSYKTLHENLTQASATVPPEIALQLSKTALDISYFSQQRNLRPEEKTDPAPKDAPFYVPSRASTVIAERIIRVGMKRTLDMLAAGDVESSCIPPSLMKHANIKPEEVILAQSLLQVSGPSSTLLHDVKFTDAIQRLLPPLVRQVEGTSDPSEKLPRLPIPDLQCLQYGRTRTVLQSQESLPDLAGEWLEAMDVEEYLAERGIVLRDDTEGGLVRLRAGSSVSQSQSPEPSIEVGLPMSPSDFSQSSTEPLHRADGGPLEPHDSLPSNWMDLYDESDFSDLAMAELDQELFENMEFHPSDITINFDKLVDGLAARTVCLGLCPAIRREGVDEAIREAVV